MCGIAALIGPSSPDELEKLTRKMISVIPHRGPDGEGAMSGPMIALGHKRLAIVDLTETGAQPMPSVDRRYWITYNGEIYNFPELRFELEKLGARFNSHCDTEVILAAYSQWGEACLEKFNGMFAFVIWDSAEDKAFIARDRFGVKPLYWWKSPEGFFALASEIKQFTTLPGWRAELNPQRAYDFLCWAITDHTEETLFKNVFHFPPGTMATVDLKLAPSTLAIRRWYELIAKPPGADPARRFLELLTDSVRLRLRADVPVGSCLSGGLDSTSIVSIMHTELGKISSKENQKTFSAVFPGEAMDESGAINESTKQIGVNNYQVAPTFADFTKSLEALIWHQDEPFASTSVFAQWEVFKLARANNVKVMLDGQGADEQIAGYHSFFGPHLFGIFKSEGVATYLRELSFLHRAHGYSRMNLFLKTFNHSLPQVLRNFARGLIGRNDSNPTWLNVEKLGATAIDPWSLLTNKIRSSRDFSHALLTSMNLQMLLRHEDRNSMAHSVEARVPFLDYRLVETSLGLPESLKISGGQTKSVLRESMKDKIPESIRIERRKIGFEAPQKTWFSSDQNRNQSSFENHWPQEFLSAHGKKMVAEFENGNTEMTPLLFRLYCFEHWRSTFAVQSAL